jgi:hypothetical protein
MHAGCIPVLIIKIKRMASLTPVEKRRISTKRKSYYKKERERGEKERRRCTRETSIPWACSFLCETK